MDIYIFGAGRVGELLLRRLRKENKLIHGFCVSNIDTNMNEVDGKPVVSVDQLVEESERVQLYIAVLERGEKTIEKELRAKGFKNIVPLDESVLEQDDFSEHRKKAPIIEVTVQMGCSVNCRYCPQETLLHSYYKQDTRRQSKMSFGEYKVYLDMLPYNCILDFSGFAEPFLNSEAIEMMEYADEQNREMTLFTTLQGLDMGGLKRIINLQFSYVVLHVADIDGFSRIPVTAEYLEMLDYIIQMKKKDGRPFVDSANCQSQPSREVLAVTNGKLRIYCEMQDRAGNLENDDHSLSFGNQSGELYCDRAVNTDHFVLLPDGTVVLCCNDYGMQHVLGNLKNQSYEDIIHGEPFLNVKRAMHIDESLPLLCRKCMYAKSVVKNVYNKETVKGLIE